MDLINNLQENEKHNIDCLVDVALKHRNNPSAIVSFYINDFGYGYAGTYIKAPEKIVKGYSRVISFTPADYEPIDLAPCLEAEFKMLYKDLDTQ